MMKSAKKKLIKQNKPDYTSRSLKFSWIAALITALSVLGHRFAVIDFQPALAGIAIGVLIGLTAIVNGLIGTLHAIKAKQPEIVSTMAGSTLGFLVVTPFFVTLLSGVGAPQIHDITTDLEHPPEFVAIKPLRTAAHNSLDRLEPENLAALQKAGYPDLGPLLLDEPFDQVFNRTVTLVRQRGWTIASASAGRVEAISTTPVMGFKDDVAIRIQAEGNRTRIDMRSTSRVGKSDLGANAARIRAFMADLDRP
jgi:hypothetical protein